MFGWLFAMDYSDQLLDRQLRSLPTPSTSAESLASGKDGAPEVPYEVVPADERFLQETERVSGVALSPQEKCQHKIFLSMGKSCGRMTEEEMSKVAVLLLNCQSEAEGRPQFTCLDSMTIAECTAGMDPDTWNAYHIVSNRARAVCYAARQQQFRASAEIAVNRLTHQAFRQSERLGQLESVHDRLQSLTSDTLQAVTFGQQQLIDQQDTLQEAQKSIQHRVSDSLQELSRVRGAIGVGHTDVLNTLRQLRRTLAQTGTQLNVHTAAANVSHQQLSEQLVVVRKAAEQLAELLQSVDGSTRQMSERLDGLMASLRLMNSTIHGLLKTVESTQKQLNDKLAWLNQILGSDIHRVCGVLQQLGVLLCGMVVLTFVQAPVSTRLLLLTLVPLNILAAMQEAQEFLQLEHIVTLLLSTTAVHYLVVWLMGKKRVAADISPSHFLKLTSSALNFNGGAFCSSNGSTDIGADIGPPHSVGSDCDSHGSFPHSASSVVGGRLVGNSSPRPLSPARSRRVSTSSSISASRTHCVATCRNGMPCRNSPTPLSQYCAVHSRVSRDSSPLVQ